MKKRLLPLISTMLVFLCIMGCARGQNVDADTVTSETESAMLESLTDKGETGGQTADYDASSLLVSEQGAVISQNTSPQQEKKDEPKNSQTAEQPVKSTAASSSAGAADSSKTSAAAAKTSAAPTKAASTSSTTTTTKASTTTTATTKAAVTTTTTTKAAVTTTQPQGGSIIVVDETTTRQQSEANVSLLISCKTAVDYGIRERPGYSGIIPENGIMLNVSVKLENGDTVMTLLVRTLRENNISLNKQGDYIRGIGGLNERDCGGTSGWLYSVNGVFPNSSMAGFKLSDGDSVNISYSVKNGDVTQMNS